MTKVFVTITALMMLLFGGVAAAQTYSTETQLTIEPTTVAAGDEVTVSGGGFAAGTTVSIVLVVDGTETELGTTEADADGNIEATVTIPDDFAGDGTIIARGQGADGGTLELSVTISNGSVEELPFTGTGSTSRWLVGAGVASIAAGVGMLVLRDWQTSR